LFGGVGWWVVVGGGGGGGEGRGGWGLLLACVCLVRRYLSTINPSRIL